MRYKKHRNPSLGVERLGQDDSGKLLDELRKSQREEVPVPLSIKKLLEEDTAMELLPYADASVDAALANDERTGSPLAETWAADSEEETADVPAVQSFIGGTEDTILPHPPLLPDTFEVGRATEVHGPSHLSANLVDDEYALTQYVKSLIPMVLIDGRLHLFREPCFRPLDDRELLTEIKAALPVEIRSKVPMPRLKRVLEQLRTEQDLERDLDRVAYDPCEIVFSNGVYNVKTREKRAGVPADLFVGANGTAFRPKRGKEGPNADAFFYEASSGDKEIEALMWTALGAMFSTEAKFKAFFYLYGPPDTGKSLFGKLCLRLIGAENCANILLHEIDAKYHGAELRGKLANISLDQPSVVIKNIGVFKQLTSGGSDVVTVEKKFGTIDRLDSRFVKFMFAGNQLPRLREYDEAFWSRMVLIPFEHQIPREQRDPNMLEKLLREKDYLIRKALKHYAKFLERGMRFPACRRAEELKCGVSITSPTDRVRQFVAACCELDTEARTLTRDLFARFYEFCREHGYHSGSEKAFSSCLKNELGFEPYRYASQRGYIGLRIAE